jgi:glycosyltransferase involved in cell wall biosynthesis
LKCYDHIANKLVPRYLGGIETQLALLAKGLVNEGCHISAVTYDHGQADAECFDGVTVFKSYNPDAGMPVARSLHPRMSRLVAAMRRADADIYLQMGAGDETGRVAIACKLWLRRTRRFVFCLASDANFGKHLHAGLLGWQGKLYKLGLRYADLIVAQTARQQEGLRAALGLESEVLNMAAPPALVNESPVSEVAQPRVAWVGRLSSEKRFEWLLEVARRLPEFTFEVAGAPNRPSNYASRLVSQANALSNVVMHGRLGQRDIQKLYRRCRILCNTSVYEGFPTTFLEAWSHGLPIVTTFDSEIVGHHGLGRVVGNVYDMVSAIRELLSNGNTYADVSAASKRFYCQNYTVPIVSKKFRAAFERLLQRRDSNTNCVNRFRMLQAD